MVQTMAKWNNPKRTEELMDHLKEDEKMSKEKALVEEEDAMKMIFQLMTSR